MPGCGRLDIVDLIDPPEVRAGHIESCAVARVGHGHNGGGAIYHSLLVGAEVHIVRGGLSARAPGEDHIRVHIGSPGIRRRLSGADRDGEEADLTETILSQDASPIAGTGQPDVLCHGAAKVNRRIVCIISSSGGLGEFRHADQSRPFGPVGRVFDGNILESETKNRLDLLVGVPHPHLVQLVWIVELVLDPGPQRLIAAKPHIRCVRRVQAVGIQSGSVDGVFRAEIRLALARSSRGDSHTIDRITNRLGCEAPDLAREYRRIRRGVDLIDAPVVLRFEIEPARIMTAGTLSDTADAVIDIVEALTEVNNVPIDGRRKLARRPAQDHIS